MFTGLRALQPVSRVAQWRFTTLFRCGAASVGTYRSPPWRV